MDSVFTDFAVGALIDLVAITLLVAMYFARHRRRDLVVAYLGINVGVLVVTMVLAHASVSAGLGLGLFGILSIIRLRSLQLAQHEIAYYFGALAIGILGGFGDQGWLPRTLPLLVIAVMFVGDHPRMMSRYRHSTVTVNGIVTDEDALRQHLATELGGEVVSVRIGRVDLPKQQTSVEVGYRLGAGVNHPVAPEAEPAGASYLPSGDGHAIHLDAGAAPAVQAD